MLVRSKITGNRLVSLPFSDFCEPLLSSIDESEKIKEAVFNYCDEQNLKFIEFRSSETKFPFETELFRTDLRHILFLNKTEDDLYKLFSENTKRNIKAAGKEGVKISVDNTSEGIKKFYELQCITRRKHGLPPQPYKFFKSIFENIISKGLGEIIFAYNNSKPVTALIFFITGEKVLYKFGASSENDLPRGTNHLLMWEAIKKYNQRGFKQFDFGRTETEHEGLRRFKLGFGAEERIIYTTRYDTKTKSFVSSDSKTTGIHNKIFQRLPIKILKIIGDSLYKHIG